MKRIPQLSMLILFVIALYMIYVTLVTPYIGILVDKDSVGQWRITKMDDLGWAASQDIHINDQIVQINGIKPDDYPTVEKFGEIENIHDLVLDRDGKTIAYHVDQQVPQNQLMYFTVIPSCTYAIILALAYFLYRKKKNDRSAFILNLFFLSVGISDLSAGGSSRGDPISMFMSGITFVSSPLIFLSFLYQYFRRFNITLFNLGILKFLVIVNGLEMLSDLLFFLGPFEEFFWIMRVTVLVVFSFSILLCLYILFSRYIKYRNSPHKPVLKIMVYGILIAFFPFVCLVALPQAIEQKELIPGSLGAAFIFFLPITFIYLITAKRLLDIDFLINRLRYYCTLAFFPTILISWFLQYEVRRQSSVFQLINTIIFVFITMVVFLYLKEALDHRLRPKLFIEKYNFQASLDRFSHDISKVMKVSNLEEMVITEITNVLPVKSVCSFEVDKHDYEIAVNHGEDLLPNDEIGEYLKNHHQVIQVGELHTFDEGLCVGIGENTTKYYMLWIGEKVNRIRFNQDELVWLKTIAQYVSMVYENLNLIEGLVEELEQSVDKQNTAPPWILRLLFNLSEKERRRLASDLHDSALQEQLLWYRKLEGLTSDASIQVELKEELNQIREGLLDVIHQIRETCNELRPALLKEIGIVEAIENLVEYAQLRTNYMVRFDAGGFAVDCNYEQVLALYRIVQELLNNATKHSKATEIDIKLASSDRKIFLSYRDNGIGVNLNEVQPTFGHIGLSGIKERVSSLEGETKFYSVEGSGLQVDITMPVVSTAGIFEQVL